MTWVKVSIASRLSDVSASVRRSAPRLHQARQFVVALDQALVEVGGFLVGEVDEDFVFVGSVPGGAAELLDEVERQAGVDRIEMRDAGVGLQRLAVLVILGGEMVG